MTKNVLHDAPTLAAGASSLREESGDFVVPVADGPRYRMGRLVAEGGMGEIRAAHDSLLDREVVAKSMRERHRARSQLRARFLREAQTQAKLEHPGIVPVYDLVHDAHGAPFFTMREVTGTTLAEVLQARRDPTSELGQRYSTRALLAVFTRVVLTVAFAHERGFVHRDLKPENVMLGEFGEVYVLDWGIAKPIEAGESSPDRPSTVVTRRDCLLGTFEYMPPEQLDDPHVADVRSDVFSLGAILFEILAGVALRPGGGPQGLREDAPSRAALAKRDDIAPELIELCLRATAPKPEERPDDARELERVITRHLDRAREVEVSQASAQRYADAADRGLRTSQPDHLDTKALAALGRALVLDPTLKERLDPILSEALDSAPEELPEGARRELERANREVVRRRATAALGIYLVWLGFIAVGFAFGTRSPVSLGLMALNATLVAALYAWVVVSKRFESRWLRLALPFSFSLVALTGTFLGPTILVPALAIATSASYLVALRADARARRWTFALAGASIIVPLVLTELGWIEPRVHVVGEHLVMDTSLQMSPAGLQLLLAAGALATVLLANLAVDRATRVSFDVERRAHLRAWRLRQVVSGESVRPDPR